MKSFQPRFDRSRLPDPLEYFEGQGLKLLERRGPWRTARCHFHGGESMRLNVKSGAWMCMNCGTRGGDVLAYHMASQGLSFEDAAKALGAWIEDGKSAPNDGPSKFSPRDALSVLRFETLLCAVAAGNLARGVALTDDDKARLLKAAARIEFVGGLVR